jgi:hypothetical protein
MIWSEMAVQLRATGHGTDMIHRIVEALRDAISAGSLYRRQPHHGGETTRRHSAGEPIHAGRGAADSRP